MVVNCFLWLISIAISALVLGLNNLFTIWYFDLIGILVIPVLYILCLGVFLMLSFIAGCAIKTKKENVKPNNFCYWFVYQVTYTLCRLTCRIKVKNKELFPKDGRFVLVYNHRSNWDPMVLMAAFNKSKIYYVTKPGNMNIPIAGPFIKRAGFIALDRNNNKNGLKSILKAIQYIKEDRGSIAIAPEGTRNKALEKPLLDFHPGSFKIAFKANVPIVVLTVKNCEMIHKNFPLKKTNVTIDVLKVIEPNDFKDKDTIEISNEVYELMMNNLKED